MGKQHRMYQLLVSEIMIYHQWLFFQSRADLEEQRCVIKKIWDAKGIDERTALDRMKDALEELGLGVPIEREWVDPPFEGWEDLDCQQLSIGVLRRGSSIEEEIELPRESQPIRPSEPVRV